MRYFETQLEFALNEAAATDLPPDSKIVVVDGGGKLTIKLRSDTIGGGIEAYRYKSESANIFVLEKSGATHGYGPLLYDIAIEAITAKGAVAVSDRKNVSTDAMRIWQYYYTKRDDVEKVELPPGAWYCGDRWINEFNVDTSKLDEDPKTWPDKSNPIWALWCGYRKKPQTLNRLRDNGKLTVQSVSAVK